MLAWSPFGLLLCAAGACAGLLLLFKGLSYRYRGDDPHCAKCHYNLTGVASEVCPECGTQQTPETTAHGEPYRRPWLAVLGIVLMLGSFASVLVLQRDQPSRPNSPSPANAIRDTKNLIDVKKACFQAGRIQGDNPTGMGTGRPDIGLGSLVLYVQDKIPARIQRCGASHRTKIAALTELQTAEQYLTSTILPSYESAIRSKKLEDARAMIPLMDQLDKHMDKLLQILKGY